MRMAAQKLRAAKYQAIGRNDYLYTIDSREDRCYVTSAALPNVESSKAVTSKPSKYKRTYSLIVAHVPCQEAVENKKDVNRDDRPRRRKKVSPR